MNVSGRMSLTGPRAAPKSHDISGLYFYGLECQRLGLLEEAEASFRKVVKKRPGHFDAWQMLGALAKQRGDSEKAAQHFRRALVINPMSAEPHANLGMVLRSMGRLEEALSCYDRAIALDPGFANAHYNRGNTLLEMGEFDAALASFDRAIDLNPAFASAHYNRGNARFRHRKLQQAIVDFDRALELDPGNAELWFNKAETMRALDRHAEALACDDKALAINEAFAAVWVGRGNSLLALKRIGEALEAGNRALAIDPELGHAHSLLGRCYTLLGDPVQALDSYARALTLDPGHEVALSNTIFGLDALDGCDVARQQNARSNWWTQIGSKEYEKSRPYHENERDPNRRIVVGYVSSDFRNHSAAFSFHPVLANHNKAEFEIICYSSFPQQDAITERFRQFADKWHDASEWTDDELAAQVRRDKVDILVDLSGHTAGNRLRTFAQKPAPVQVTAWGHATGTGIPVIDYLFADPVLIDVGHRDLFAEKIYDLPCFMIIDPPPPEYLRQEPPCLSNGFMTFGVFNRTDKLTENTVSVWSEILRRSPNARLIIKAIQLDDPAVRARILEKFTSYSVDANRIELLGRTRRDEHLTTYSRVDICLDPFPMNGGISTWEALHMGVPVVAKLGPGPSARAAGAILSAAGMSDWVASTNDEYVRIALEASADRLARLRRNLPAMIEERCSLSKYTSSVERAYRMMWKRYCESSTDHTAEGQADAHSA